MSAPGEPFTQIEYAVADHVATITLHRPEKLNAFTGRMCQELLAAFDRSDADDDVRAVVVTGSGRAFCAGADLSAGAATFDSENRDPADRVTGIGGGHRDGGGLVTLRIFRSLKPVIAAVNGPAVGIGATMTLAMDMRLAADSARIGFVFGRRGITPEAASSFFLPRVVGIATALEWTLTGRLLSAAEARDAGLLRSTHPADELLPAAYTLAAEIADNVAPVSAAITRQMMWRMLGASHPMEAHRLDSAAIASRGASADAAEGIESFLAKRPAAFPLTVGKDLPDIYPWESEPEFEV